MSATQELADAVTRLVEVVRLIGADTADAAQDAANHAAAAAPPECRAAVYKAAIEGFNKAFARHAQDIFDRADQYVAAVLHAAGQIQKSEAGE